MADLDRHRDYLLGEWSGARAAPLSARKAMLVAMLIDAYVDRLFAADHPANGDVLAFRAEMGAQSPALGRIMALCSGRGIRLVTEPVQVPLAEYDRLSVEDFMVSLYNDHSVQRLMLVKDDGRRHDMLDTLRDAVSALRLE